MSLSPPIPTHTQELIIHKPKDPLPFLIDRLRNPLSQQRIIVSGFGNAADAYVHQVRSVCACACACGGVGVCVCFNMW
jgi:hypothetical protein